MVWLGWESMDEGASSSADLTTSLQVYCWDQFLNIGLHSQTLKNDWLR